MLPPRQGELADLHPAHWEASHEARAYRLSEAAKKGTNLAVEAEPGVELRSGLQWAQEGSDCLPLSGRIVLGFGPRGSVSFAQPRTARTKKTIGSVDPYVLKIPARSFPQVEVFWIKTRE